MADAEIIEIDIPGDEEYEIGEEGDLGDEFVAPEDSPNMVYEFSAHPEGVEALRKLSAKCLDDFDEAWRGCEERREKNANDWKIFTGNLPEKPYPFKNCANVHVPSMFENITRITFRMIGELFGDFSNVFGVTPVGPDDEETAEILSKHGNWQLREGIPDFRSQMHRGVLLYTTHGDVVCASSYDMVERRNKHEVLTTDEWCIPYAYTSCSPDFSDIPYNCRIRRYYRHELEQMRDVWFGVEEILDGEAPSWEDEPEQLMRDAAEEWEGIIKPEGDGSSAPYKLIEWEGWADLPGHDRQRYIRVIIDYNTHGILSLSLHEQDDWKDVERYERQQRELRQYQEAQEVWDAAMGVQEAAVDDLRANPNLGPEATAQLEQGTPPPPEPPSWYDGESSEPKPPRKVPIRLFAHGVCIEPPTGNQGYGFGGGQADFNRAMNTALDQYTDAATLSNGGSLITTGLVEFERPLDLGPGRINKAKGVTAGELRNNIMEMPTGQPSQGLIEIVNMMYGYAQSSMQSPDVLSGEPGKSGETYRGIATRVEQATKQLSVATRKFADPFVTQVLKNNALLNSIFLDDAEVFMVNNHKLNDETGQLESIWEQQEVGKKMYRRNYNVQFRSDLKYGTDVQKINDADQLVQSSLTVPILQQNPAFQYAALKKALEARNQEDMIPFLGPPPPAPNAPMPAMPPQQQGGTPPKPQE